MFFLLSKTLNYLTMPVVVMCILMTLSAILRSARWKKILFRSGLGLLLFTSNYFIANEFARLWEVPPIPFTEVTKKYEWAILLTGVTKSNVDPQDRVHFQRGADRVVHTVYLYKAGLIKKVLVSGGDGTILEIRRKEADEIREALVLMGVSEADIIIEPNSRNTYESAEEVKKILASQKLEGPFLLVTSAFHMRRSLGCFRKAGIDVDPFSTDLISFNRKYTPDTTIVPRIEAILVWHILVKEYVGMTAYWITGKI